MNLRFATSFVSIAAAVAVFATGCSKDQKSTAVAEPVATPPAPLYASFPSATNIVVGIDVKAILASPLGAKLKSALAANTGLAEMNEACGFAPLEKIESVMIGGDPEAKDTVLVAVRGLTDADFQACASGISAAGKTAVYSPDGQFASVSFAETADAQQPEQTWIYWSDPRTLVFGEPSSGPDARTWLETQVNSTTKLTDSASFQALVEKVDTNANVWVAVFAESEPIDIAGQVQDVRGTIDVENGMALDFAVRYPTADAATTAAKQIGMYQQMFSAQPGIGPLLAKVTVKANGSEVAIQGAWTQAEVDGLTQLMMMAASAPQAAAPAETGVGPAATAPAKAAPEAAPAGDKAEAPAKTEAGAEPKN